VLGRGSAHQTCISQLLQVNTLFPSPKTEEGIKGGVVLLRMQPPNTANAPLRLTVTYTDRAGKTYRRALRHGCMWICKPLHA
jgi:hypothetical protein